MLANENFGRTSAATLAAGGADEVRLDVGQPDIIGPAVGIDRCGGCNGDRGNQYVTDAGW